jgi:hypothetical protein
MVDFARINEQFANEVAAEAVGLIDRGQATPWEAQILARSIVLERRRAAVIERAASAGIPPVGK